MGSTPTSITLSWNYTCEPEASSGDMIYKVYYEHMEWMACATGVQDEDRGPGRGNYETSETVLVFENLHPYSAYKLTVKALPPRSISRRLPEELSRVGETLADIPDVMPEKGSIQTRVEEDGLKFYWRDPPQSQCRQFNGRLDGVYYILKGTDRWNLQEEQRGTTVGNSFEFESLLPYSSYMLFLYAKNAEGSHNINLPLRLKSKTTPARPTQPLELTDATTSSDKSRRLISWLPPYPPTGEIRMYTLRWRRSNSTDWEEKADVFPGDELCSDDAGEQGAKPVCHAVSGLASGLNYTFQVSAYNEAIPQRGPWSGILESGAATPDIILGVGKNIFIMIIVASLVGVLLFVLLVTFLSYHCTKKQRKQYKNVPNYAPGPANSTFTASTSFNSLPMRATTAPSHRDSVRSSFNGASGGTVSRSTCLTDDTLRKYHHHLLPVDDRTSRTGSIQEQPLPPLPRDDHLYEELHLKTEPDTLNTAGAGSGAGSRPRSTSSPAGAGDVNGLNPRPTGLPLNETSFQGSRGSDLDDSDYLAPRTARSRKASTDTIDMDDYLKPTFDRFEHIDPNDMSPPREAPPPIPTVSYGSRGTLTKY